MSAQKDSFYYFGPLITIQVEGMLFRVPRREFEEESEVFASMFSLPPGSEEGHDDEHPLRLEGVTADDFRCFLGAANPRRALSYESLGDKELENALRLATMWGFLKLREGLIHDLESLNLKPTRYLQLAQAYNISKWYKDQLRLLAFRPDSLSTEEGIQLGGELTAIVSLLRDQRFDAIPDVPLYVNKAKTIYGKEVLGASGPFIQRHVDRKLDGICKAHGWE